MYALKIQAKEFNSYTTKAITILIALIAASTIFMTRANAQGTYGLRDPLVGGASSQLPFVPAPLGARPPIGSGSTPLTPPVGMTGLPLTIPSSLPAIPATQLGTSFSGVGLPSALPMALPSSGLPGGWSYALFPFVPNSPSSTGPARTMLQNNNTNPNQAMLTNILPTGRSPGTGGYYTSIPKVRAIGTNKSTQYEYRGQTAFLGGGGTSQDIVTQFGPLAGFGQVNGIPTGVGYNKGPAGSYGYSSLFNKSIDLGGGTRVKIGNQILSNGKTVQDLNGYSALYGNGNPLTRSTLSTDFAQGARVAFPSAGQNINHTTDFGFPLTPATASLNGHPNEARGNPSLVETNF